MGTSRTVRDARAASVIGLGLLLLLGACSTPEDAAALEDPAALEAQTKPDRERFVDEPYREVHDCRDVDSGEVVFVDEGVESGQWRDFFDRQGRLTRSIGNLRSRGTFTDVDTGYELSYQSAVTVTLDYASRKTTLTGLWLKVMDQDGSILGHNVGRWILGPEGLSGSGQLDIGLICPFFPQD